MRNKLFQAALIITAVLVTGCAGGGFSHSKRTVESPWKSFDEVKKNYDKIKPHKTTIRDLQKINIEPFIQPNIEIKRHSWVTNYFLPNESIKKKDLDEGLRDCIGAGNYRCYGMELKIKVNEYKEYGNLLKNWIGIEKKRVTKGWYFYALILIKDGVVVYKEWDGSPNIKVKDEKGNPLGPFQKGGDFIVDGVKKIAPVW